MDKQIIIYKKECCNEPYCSFSQVLEQLEAKEQECEELEKELRQKKMTILMNNDHYFEVDKTNRKLKQALTEIKEIANKFNYWNSNLSQASEILHEIIEKISKCEGNDE